MLQVFLIRHAESEGNVNHHLVGGQSNHLPLSGRGEDQAHRLGRRLAAEGQVFDAVFASSALRAQETARIACSYLHQAPPAEVRPELVELAQGDWEGRLRADIYTPELLLALRADPYDFRPPGGESQRDVEARMYRWLDEIVQRFDQTDKLLRVAAFSHGFAIKTLVAGLTQAAPSMTYRTIIHNTSLTVLHRETGLWYIDRVNDHQHLIGTEFIGHY